MRSQKIAYLLQHRPRFWTNETSAALAWPLGAVKAQGYWVGFMMKKMEGLPLEILCTPRLPKRLGQEWQRFDFRQQEAALLRRKLCFNLAVAIWQVHASGNYAFLDLKPDNILVQPNGLVSLVDIDSIEVLDKQEQLFAAPVATPEYSPPEYHRPQLRQGKYLPEIWDRFSMSVIFYKLLLGIHPFAATAKTELKNGDALWAKIEADLFVHQAQKKQELEVIPQLHQAFYQLPTAIQDCFMQCFAFGAEQPYLRPTAEEWCQALSPAMSLEQSPRAAFPPILLPLPKTAQEVKLPDSFFISWPQLIASVSIAKLKDIVAISDMESPKSHWWAILSKKGIKKKTKIINFLPLDLIQKLKIQNWKEKDIEKLGQWLVDNIDYQNNILEKVKQEQEELKNEYQKSREWYLTLEHNTNRQLALTLQQYRQEMTQAYRKLEEDRYWKKYRGLSLDSKIKHLQQCFEGTVIEIKDQYRRLVQQIEKQKNEELQNIDKAYYSKLQQIEKNAQQKKEQLKDVYWRYYQQNIIKNSSYQEQISIEQEVSKLLELELKILQEQYFNRLDELEKQYGQNLQHLGSKEGKQKERLLEFMRQQQLLNKMQEQELGLLSQHYEQQKAAIEAKKNQQKDEQEKRKKEIVHLIEKEYKDKLLQEPLRIALDGLQKEVLLLKSEGEKTYIEARQQCFDQLTQLKNNLEIELRETITKNEQNATEEEQSIRCLYQQYQYSLNKSQKEMKNSYEQALHSLEAAQNKLKKQAENRLKKLEEEYTLLDEEIKRKGLLYIIR